MKISRSASDIFKAVAIIGIVINHLALPLDILGKGGVFVFLFLSGYGLQARYGGRKLNAGEFIKKRFYRVVVPFWAVLTGFLAYLFIFANDHFTQYFRWQEAVLNYALIVFKPIDILTVGWFVSYVVFLYLCFLAFHRRTYLLWQIPIFIFLIRQPLLAFLSANVAFFDPNAMNALYLPFAFAFPLGVYAQEHLPSIDIALKNPLLELIGRHAYWIYLLHIPLLRVVENLHL